MDAVTLVTWPYTKAQWAEMHPDVMTNNPVEITPEMRKAGAEIIARLMDQDSTAIGGVDSAWRYENEADELFRAMLKARVCPASIASE